MDNKNIGESAKLIKPLFVDGNFNRDGKRIRAKHVKDISCDGAEYSLWISAGSNEKDYPEGENDTHYLYALIGEYLVPCATTEYKLEQDAGYEQLVKVLYGCPDEREIYFDELRKGKDWDESNKLVSMRIAEENEYIKIHGKNEQAQAEHIKSDFDRCIFRYVEARDAGGKYADFIGATIMGEIDRCMEIANVLRAERKTFDAQRMEDAKKRKEAEEADREQQELNAIIEAEGIFRDGGKITSGEMIIRLSDKYGVNIPIRTRGWILNTFAECTVANGSISGIRFFKCKGGNGSTRIWDILRDLQNVIVNKEWVDCFLSNQKNEAI